MLIKRNRIAEKIYVKSLLLFAPVHQRNWWQFRPIRIKTMAVSMTAVEISFSVTSLSATFTIILHAASYIAQTDIFFSVLWLSSSVSFMSLCLTLLDLTYYNRGVIELTIISMISMHVVSTKNETLTLIHTKY